MGAAISQASGFYHAYKNEKKQPKIVATIGDSTFFHSGIPGLINAVFNNHNITLVILDNRTTAMTGAIVARMIARGDLKAQGFVTPEKIVAGKAFDILVDELAAADAIIFGTPTRFGNMCGQMRQFLDATGQLWSQGALVGKVGSVFASTATQHGGQESTLLSFHITLLHQGLVVVGLPYAFQGQMRNDEITGCSPYGATTIAGTQGERTPTENELAGARFQGKHVASITSKLTVD